MELLQWGTEIHGHTNESQFVFIIIRKNVTYIQWRYDRRSDIITVNGSYILVQKYVLILCISIVANTKRWIVLHRKL